MKNLKHLFAFLITICFLQSCNQPTVKISERVSKNEEVKQSKNITETISTDIDTLGALLDFSTYRPTKVKFKYTYIDNSGQNNRISVPGPSDNLLEAILHFDTITMETFYEFDRNADYDTPNFNKEEFNFNWLPKDIQKELLDSNPNYHGHPDFFFGTNHYGKSWYLKNKILIKYYSK
ncbi:hypothetical protein [Mangrovimonas xylaniphaga]|uniref:hypothetical protein n=1 Tax=Mangrovimonas xylaniphaga TaxID=1645915 RepID=UPI000A746314|nr:hypothetical protein [Mangrovimonas xylaniphaga]